MIDLNEHTKEDILVILEERDALLEVLRKMTSAAQDIDGDEYFLEKPSIIDTSTQGDTKCLEQSEVQKRLDMITGVIVL